ncbi:Uncharacterised protein [Mycobacteroides abscessus subsp. massiliense]|uniref:TNT domain-containing protein n=1 Tax=Mycobacteroides abscessus TaxID=36809 RepID=UPI0002D373EC|nr:TNT domain-containing protein [Mycobacteroides abscessus]ANO00218.1 hypothetical protein BAB74_16970 [Mycobacteroides abscessus]SLF10762.1 Uncharacterised protein [Mycobacteroides abscessus subsp. massiliense]SLG78970.1 Uncharacterised protein [Mycobacteroides abscessus subsp. massiliense]
MTTLDEFMAKKANDYMAVVDTWRPQTRQFKEVYDEYKRWAGAPAGTEWTGRTANAAYETASTDCHGSDNADDAAEDAVTLATATITYEVVDPLVNGQRLIERVLEHKDQGVSIDQNFNMHYTPAEGESDDSVAHNRQHVADTERQVKEYVGKWEKGCQTLKAQADATAQKITGCINPKTALVDGRKILRDAVAPKPGDGPATAIDYKKLYPKTTVDGHQLGSIGAIPGVHDGSQAPEPSAAATRAMGAVPPFDPNSPATKAGLDALRKDLESKGWTPQQIDAGINRMLAPGKTVAEPSPWKSPDGKTPPRPGFAEGFGDGWNSFFDGMHNLTGQEGVDKFVEGWKDLGKGVGTEIFERTANPIGAGISDIKDAKDLINSPNPGYTIGHIAGEAAPGVATLPFGGEGMAVRAGLPAEVLTEGGAPAAILKDWNPTGGMPWKEFESQFGTPGEARIWPTENQGFPPGYVPHEANLPPGTIIDRFGSDGGRYLAPDGTPFADRALAPESVGGAYNRYMVTGQPLPPGWRIVEGPLQPFYGQTPSPGTVQYMIEAPDGVRPSVAELVDRGILDEYGPPLGR